jgi:hypothetical protein
LRLFIRVHLVFVLVLVLVLVLAAFIIRIVYVFLKLDARLLDRAICPTVIILTTLDDRGR